MFLFREVFPLPALERGVSLTLLLEIISLLYSCAFRLVLTFAVVPLVISLFIGFEL